MIAREDPGAAGRRPPGALLAAFLIAWGPSGIAAESGSMAVPGIERRAVLWHEAEARAREALVRGAWGEALERLEPLPATVHLDGLRALAVLGSGAPDASARLRGYAATHPADPHLRMLLARALLRAGRSASAVATLVRDLPELRTHPDYYGVLAAALLLAGQGADAARVYEALLAEVGPRRYWRRGLARARGGSGGAGTAPEDEGSLPGLAAAEGRR